MTDIIRHSDVDISKIHYQKPSRQGNVYYSSITYEDSKPLYIQTPKLKFQKITSDNHLCIKTSDTECTMYNKLCSIDEHNLGKTYELSKEWFNKALPMDIIESMYRRITHPCKKDEIPEIKIKLPVMKKDIKCNIYDSSNQLSDKTMLEPNIDIICIIHVKGLKFLKKDYYCDCYVSQIKICNPILYSIPGECIIEDEPYDDTYDNTYAYECFDEEVLQQLDTLRRLQSEYEVKQEELDIIKKQIDELK